MRKVNRRAVLGVGGSLFLASVAGAQSDGGDGNGGRSTDGNGDGDGDDEPGESPGLRQIGRYESGLYDEGGAEIPTYDPRTQQVFVVNAGAGVVDVIDVSDPQRPAKVDEIDGSEAFAGAGATNSVDVYAGVLAVAIANEDGTARGRVAFYDTTSRQLITTVRVGVLPDMVTVSPDGRYVLTANEAEPTSDYSTDPVGSISVVDVRNTRVRTAGFDDFDAETLREAGVRIYGPGSSAAQDLEPEFVTVSADSSTAYVTLQENNALAVVDLATATVTDVVPLGYKDHRLVDNGFGEDNALDAVDDGEIDVRNEPLLGMYQPDSISSIEIDGDTYLVTANEGDAREYDALFEVGFLTETSEGDYEFAVDEDTSNTVDVDESAFNGLELERLDALSGEDGEFGLEATVARGDVDDDGAIEQIHVFGGRSYAIWRATDAGVELVYESGDRLERITAEALPENFNSDDDSVNDLDGESAASGPEPEGTAAGYVDGTPVAFVGLEEVGGVAMFDISDPAAPTLVEYVNNRIFDLTELGLAADADLGDAIENGDIEPGDAGDLGPEGLLFVPAEDSPAADGRPLLVVGNEVSGTTTIYEASLRGDDDSGNDNDGDNGGTDGNGNGGTDGSSNGDGNGTGDD
jgi:hypothetical protein